MLYVRNQEKETIVKKGTSDACQFFDQTAGYADLNHSLLRRAFFYMANLSITLAPGGADPPEYGDLAQRKNTPEKSPVAKRTSKERKMNYFVGRTMSQEVDFTRMPRQAPPLPAMPTPLDLGRFVTDGLLRPLLEGLNTAATNFTDSLGSMPRRRLLRLRAGSPGSSPLSIITTTGADVDATTMTAAAMKIRAIAIAVSSTVTWWCTRGLGRFG
jgi:hypothetical protein